MVMTFPVSDDIHLRPPCHDFLCKQSEEQELADDKRTIESTRPNIVTLSPIQMIVLDKN